MDIKSIIFLIVYFSVSLCACQFPKVTISQGSIVGNTVFTRGGREILAFRGIPYAAPPTGQLRFKSPEPPLSWNGDRDASRDGNICLQQFVLIEKLRNDVSGSEDCLFLNVFTPALTGKNKLPVMFFIHGGGFSGGSGSMAEYGPELLLDRDVVLVTINYRLGPLGFLSTGDSVIPGNFGLKDQQAALQWVQQNIEQFGGNKSSVTIFGESAGGASVHFHMLSPKSKGLFHSAISQSGTALCPWAFSTAARHKKLTDKLAQLSGCPNQPSTELLQCLKKLPAEQIVSTLKNYIVWDLDPVVLFNPAIETEEVEDAFITNDPWTLKSNIPWMLGFNENEGGLKTSSLTQGDVNEKFKQFSQKLSQLMPMSLLYESTSKDPTKVTESIKRFYFGEADNITLDMVHSIRQMYTDAWFSHGVLEAARRHNGPVFLYYFAYNSSFSLCSHFFNNPEYPGVCHFDDLLYLFPMEGNSPKLVLSDPDYIMSKTMVELWTNYATNSFPSLDSSSLWKSRNGSKVDYLLMTNNTFGIRQGLISDRDQFWQSLPYREKPELMSPNKPITEEL